LGRCDRGDSRGDFDFVWWSSINVGANIAQPAAEAAVQVWAQSARLNVVSSPVVSFPLRK
jgi:hypothetical protein